MVMRIYETQMDIDEGKRHDTRTCAVARAMHRQLGKPVSVGGYYGLIGDEGGDCVDVRLGDDVCTFVRAFDLKQPVQPFWFDVELPDPSPTPEPQEAVPA